MIRIIEKPEWISFEEITDVLHDAHRSNTDSGMQFKAAVQTPQDTEKRLGSDGRFFVALTDDSYLAGVAAISYHESGSYWFNKGRPCMEVKMVGVREAFKGRGISGMLYSKMEEYGFSRVDILFMNTAEENQIVLKSNGHHGWRFVDYKHWPETNYYSPFMAKWKNGCPYSDSYRHIRFMLRYFRARLLRTKSGSYRMPFALIKRVIH